MIYIIPETNFLRIPYNKKTDYTRFDMNNNFRMLNELRYASKLKEEVIVAVPEMVCRELHQHKLEAYIETCNQVRSLFNCLGDYGKAELFVAPEEYSKILGEQMDACIRQHDVKIVPVCEKEWFESIIHRAIQKMAPFEGKTKESDKGFKDVVIWYSILSYAKSNPGEYIFITNDGIFHNSFRELKTEFEEVTGSVIYFYRNYEEVLQHVVVKDSEQYIESVYIDDIEREIILKHSNTDYSARLKYVLPKVFAEQDVLTFINQDIKRIYEDASSYWDDVDLGLCVEDEASYAGSMYYSTKYNRNGLLSVLFLGEIYLGGPHGTPSQRGRVYELSTGKVLGLCELLGMEEEAVLRLIYERWKEDKKKRGNDVYWDDFQPNYKTSEDVKFYLDDGGIHVFFDIYEAACYAEGFVEFLLADHAEIGYFNLEKLSFP